jgi:hypothetical protein
LQEASLLAAKLQEGGDTRRRKEQFEKAEFDTNMEVPQATAGRVEMIAMDVNDFPNCRFE